MKIPSSRDHQTAGDDQTMTPMIDVVFNLLIFFVCASIGQTREQTLATELNPGSIETTTAAKPEERKFGDVWIFLKKKAGTTSTRVQLGRGGEEYELAVAETKIESLAAVSRELPVILDIAPEVPMGDVLRIYDGCRAARFQSIQFAASPAAVGPLPRKGTGR